MNHTRNTGISSIPIPLPDFFLSFSSRSRRAFNRCLTSDSDERDSSNGSDLTGGDGAGGIGLLEGFEDGGIEVGATRGVTSRKALLGGFAGGGVGALAFRGRWGGSLLVGKGVGLAALIGGREGIRGGGRDGRRDGASRSSSSSVSDIESLAA